MDNLKVNKTKEIGISLIHIPYWWDKKISSLRATIATIRPDIISSKLKITDIAIPMEPLMKSTEKIRRKKNEIKSKFMLASLWNNDDDPTGWYGLFFKIIFIIFLLFLFLYIFFIFILF